MRTKTIEALHNNAILRCDGCGRMSSPMEVMSRVFLTNACGHCGSDSFKVVRLKREARSR